MSSENYLEDLVEEQNALTDQAHRIYGYQCSECNCEITDHEIISNIEAFGFTDDEILCSECWERWHEGLREQIEERKNPDDGRI